LLLQELYYNAQIHEYQVYNFKSLHLVVLVLFNLGI
jgi:hypothetical protein